jgi:hypothetical protein
MKNEKKESTVSIVISPPKMESICVTIEGITPYVQNRFSAKAFEAMKEKQESETKEKPKRAAKDFKEMYLDATHRGMHGEYGIPASALRSAMIAACRVTASKMTMAKLSVFVEANAVDKIDGIPLVKFNAGFEPHYSEHHVRFHGTFDIHARPMWDPGWRMDVTITYDADVFSRTTVINLLARAGHQVGVGEGRPFSKDSDGMGWGTFKLLNKEGK